jgi:hypothetical protein
MKEDKFSNNYVKIVFIYLIIFVISSMRKDKSLFIQMETLTYLLMGISFSILIIVTIIYYFKLRMKKLENEEI